MDAIYPYPVDADSHPLAWIFFNVPGAPRFDIDVANTLARHLETGLGIDLTPDVTHPASIKYDALGGTGAPWENGIWIPREESRMTYTTSAAPVDVTAMDSAQRAELRQALELADIADASGANPHTGEENGR